MNWVVLKLFNDHMVTNDHKQFKWKTAQFHSYLLSFLHELFFLFANNTIVLF